MKDTFDEIKARHEVSAPFQGECVGSKAMYNQAREDRAFLLEVIATFERHCVAASDVDAMRERCAKVADDSAQEWREGKAKLRPEDEEGGHMYDAHDRFRNYISNAERLAERIRALKN